MVLTLSCQLHDFIHVMLLQQGLAIIKHSASGDVVPTIAACNC